jgi:hypothetical protein
VHAPLSRSRRCSGHRSCYGCALSLLQLLLLLLLLQLLLLLLLLVVPLLALLRMAGGDLCQEVVELDTRSASTSALSVGPANTRAAAAAAAAAAAGGGGDARQWRS